MRYIDADKLLEKVEEIEWFNEGTGFYDRIVIVHKYDVETAPTADVVPKSEAERWRRNLEAVLEEIPETKREVAREIFEEIERTFTVKYSMCTNPVLVLDSLSFAELKKKYTEGEK